MRHTHPMGECKRKRAAGLIRAGEKDDTALAIDKLGGRMHVRWDAQAAATPHGQLVFFAEFLAATGVFDRWVKECPLEYASNSRLRIGHAALERLFPGLGPGSAAARGSAPRASRGKSISGLPALNTTCSAPAIMRGGVT